MSEERSVIVKIDTWTFVRFWGVIIAFLAIGWALWSIRAGLVIVLTALFFSVILNPLVSFFARLISGSRHKRRPLAVLISYILVIVVVGGILAFIVPVAVSQITHFFEAIPNIIEESGDRLGALSDLADQYGVSNYLNGAIESFKNGLGAVFSDFQSGILSSAGSIVSFFASFFLIVVLTYLFLSEGSLLMRKFWDKRPATPANTRLQRTVSRMAKAFSDYAHGQLTIAMVDAAFGATAIFIISLIFGLPVGFAVPLGLFVGIMCMIPMFGATIGSIIVALIIAFSSIPAAITFVVCYFIYQQIEVNIITPRIQGRRSAISPLVVLIAITIGLFAGGIIGAILAVPIVNCIKVIYEEYGTDIRHTVGRTRKPRHG